MGRLFFDAFKLVQYPCHISVEHNNVAIVGAHGDRAITERRHYFINVIKLNGKIRLLLLEIVQSLSFPTQNQIIYLFE